MKSLIDFALNEEYERVKQLGDRLMEIESVIDREAFRRIVGEMYENRSKRGGAVILPILLEDVEVPALLRDVMYLDLRDGDVSKAVKNLSEAIKFHLQDKKSNEL